MLFDDMEPPIISYVNNDTNGKETSAGTIVAQLQEAELEQLHQLEQRRSQIQVKLLLKWLNSCFLARPVSFY